MTAVLIVVSLAVGFFLGHLVGKNRGFIEGADSYRLAMEMRRASDPLRPERLTSSDDAPAGR